MIVAPGTGNRKAQHRTRNGIDSVLPFVGLNLHPTTVVVFRAKAKETERDEVLRDAVDFIRSQLEADELVVRQVAVESIDDPFAIPIGVRIKHRRVAAHLMRLVLRVTRQRLPQADQPLAKPRRREQAFRQSRVSVGAFVFEKCLDLFRCRRQTGQVKCYPANERPLVRLRRRRKVRLFEAGEDEVIQRLTRPRFVLHRRPCLSRGRTEGPKLALLVPVNSFGNLGFLCFLGRQRGHGQARTHTNDGRKQQCTGHPASHSAVFRLSV